jgi:hypothetical protein
MPKRISVGRDDAPLHEGRAAMPIAVPVERTLLTWSCPMEDKAATKSHFIKAYFDDLQSRIGFLAELHAVGRGDVPDRNPTSHAPP